MIPCPNPSCENFGKKCFRCCNHCGEPVRWRPKGMDWGVKYTGPKPLNWDDGKKHECMHPHTKDGKWYKTEPKSNAATMAKEMALNSYNKELSYFLHNGYPALAKHGHYERVKRLGRGLQQICDNTECPCNKVEAMKDPIIKTEWEDQHMQWVDKWNPEITNPKERYVPCLYCKKLMVKERYLGGICDSCYWLDVYWNQGGVKVEPQRWI